MNIELPQYSLAFYIHDIFIVVWLLHTLITNIFSFPKFVKKYFTTHPKLQLFVSLAVVSLLINLVQNTDFTSVIYMARLLTYILFGFSVSFLVQKKQIQTEYLKFQVFAVGLFSLFLGFIQFVFIKDTRFLSILGWDDHYARLISTYFDPGFTGLIFLITLLIGLTSKYLQNKKAQLLILITFVWGIILTFSRATYLATATSFIAIAVSQISFNKNLVKNILLGSILFIAMIIFAPKPWGEGVNLLRTSTINARIDSIMQQLQTLEPQTVVLGNGPFSEKNSLNYNQEREITIIPSHSRVPDNIFINVLLSTGVFGLLLFVTLIFKWGGELKQKNIYLFAAFLGILLHTQFNSSLIQPFVLLIFLLGVASYSTD